MPNAFVSEYLRQLQDALSTLDPAPVETLIEWIKQTRTSGNSMYVIGNGGSASTASHFATDLGKGASIGASSRFRVLSLTDNVPWITALGNDIGFDAVFAEQLENFARPNDLVLSISVSGNSPNLVRAIERSVQNGCRTAALLGKDGGALGKLVDLPIIVRSEHYGRVEDIHLVLTHIACYYFMES